jgi:hypothetical protein
MAQGQSWQLAVATPIKNHHFEFGQNYVATLQSGIEANSQFIKVDPELYHRIEDVIQYRDQILVGPSSNSDNKSEIEHVPITGCRMDWTGAGNPTKIYLLNKNNEFAYEVGDRVSFYGTGMAGGWEIPQTSLLSKSYFQAQGIQRGAIARRQWHSAQADDGSKLPEQDKYNYIHNGGRPFLWYGLGDTVNEYSFLLDIDETYGDKLEYIITPVETISGKQYAKVAVNVANYGATHNFLYGDYHKGGWRKQYAQRIAIGMNNATPTGTFFRQNLLRSGTEDIRERSLIIPYQYYRIGGRIYWDTSFTTQNFKQNYNIYCILRANTYTRDYGGEYEYILVSAITDSTTPNTWHTFSTVGLLNSGLHKDYPPAIDLWFQNNGIPSPYKGELIMYIDDLFVEHGGGANYAHIDGCLDFGRYEVWPEHDSLKISKVERAGTTSLYGKKERYVVSFRLNYVSQEFWDQFELITEWQEKGFLLNLHPYINDLPLTLTGKLNIKDYNKDNWDLNLRSFTVEFTEE